MRKTKLLLLAALLSMAVTLGVSAQSPKSATKYTAMFYNIENVFDTINNNGIYDVEFSPHGSKRWNSVKYWKKMHNLDRVIYDVTLAEKTFPVVIGVSEIENRSVLEDLVTMPNISRANYNIVHYDSPGARGVDVALMYRPDIFNYEGSESIPVVMPEIEGFVTRDILSVWGRIEGEKFYFFVMHWPSRLGGAAASEPKRMGAAKILKEYIEVVTEQDPDARVVIMGDMNDDPANKSLAQVLDAKRKAEEVGKDELFNPFWEMHRRGIGTLAYGDTWNLFDNVIVNENLLNGTSGELKLYKRKNYYGYVFSKPYMFQQEGQYKGYPLRTYIGDAFQDGYSDHLPVYIIISK